MGGGSPRAALLQPMDPRLGERVPIVLELGWSGGLNGLVTQLAALSYTRTPMKDREQVDVTIEQAADAVLMLVHDGLEATQNRVHAT